MLSTTMLYQETEIILTGRKATRNTPPDQPRRGTSVTQDSRVEITPADQSIGTWKRWVKREDLYTITENAHDDQPG